MELATIFSRTFSVTAVVAVPRKGIGTPMDSTLASRRRMLIPIVALGLLAAGSAAAETRIGGTLSESTTWTKQQSPYVVTADVTVPPGVTLTIEPGVTVRFKPDITDMHGDNKFDLEMQVQGSLIAHGAEGDTIYFTTDAATPRWTDWQGIVAHGKKASVDLQAVNIEYSNQGIRSSTEAPRSRT